MSPRMRRLRPLPPPPPPAFPSGRAHSTPPVTGDQTRESSPSRRPAPQEVSRPLRGPVLGVRVRGANLSPAFLPCSGAAPRSAVGRVAPHTGWETAQTSPRRPSVSLRGLCPRVPRCAPPAPPAAAGPVAPPGTSIPLPAERPAGRCLLQAFRGPCGRGRRDLATFSTPPPALPLPLVSAPESGPQEPGLGSAPRSPLRTRAVVAAPPQGLPNPGRTSSPLDILSA